MSAQILDTEGFRIIRRLGTGARTTIYLAVDESNQQQVALKRAVFEAESDQRIFEQIETEYKAAQKFDHPYIRKCYRLIKKRKMLKVTQLLLSMEMFKGRTLEESKALSLGDVILIFRMVATGLNAMHQAGYVHCDIEPNNILINEEGSIKIIDLGQSCKIGTVKTRIQGTPDYIAPEQVRREPLGHRTDIFNLGATMYWALTGKNVPTLIPKKTDFGVPVAHLKPFRAPHQVFRKIPKRISKLVMDCVKEKPAERPANMAEIIARLDVLIRKIFGARYNKNGSTDN